MGMAYIQFKCADSFKSDVEQWAEDMDLTVSVFMREAARQKAGRNEASQ